MIYKYYGIGTHQRFHRAYSFTDLTEMTADHSTLGVLFRYKPLYNRDVAFSPRQLVYILPTLTGMKKKKKNWNSGVDIEELTLLDNDTVNNIAIIEQIFSR